MKRTIVTRKQWKLIVWIPIILGAIIFCIFNSTFLIPSKYMQISMISGIGGILIGWGFGLAYARYFKIKGIDENE